LTAVIIYWNTVHLGHAVTERRNEGLDVPPEFLPHISPLGWAHILLTGEYLWPKEPKAGCHFALSRNRPLKKRLDDFHHVLPWQNLLHAGQENLFSGLTALTAEFTVGEGKLMTHR
jgi:hypothetical protein